MAHKNKAQHDQMRAQGAIVIEGHALGRYVVLKWIGLDRKTMQPAELTDGIDDEGEPIGRLNGNGGESDPATITYIPQGFECDIYTGDTPSEVKSKIEVKVPDLQKIKGAKNVQAFTGTRIADLNRM